jgi:hypothetical protein
MVVPENAKEKKVTLGEEDCRLVTRQTTILIICLRGSSSVKSIYLFIYLFTKTADQQVCLKVTL